MQNTQIDRLTQSHTSFFTLTARMILSLSFSFCVLILNFFRCVCLSLSFFDSRFLKRRRRMDGWKMEGRWWKLEKKERKKAGRKVGERKKGEKLIFVSLKQAKEEEKKSWSMKKAGEWITVIFHRIVIIIIIK